MSNNNFNFPNSPWLYILIAVGAFLVLLATGHISTAVVLFLALVGIIVFIYNFATDNATSTTWGICIACLLLALILGLLFVPGDWQIKVVQAIPTQTPIIPTPVH